jgi:hypothetical protein
LVFLIWLLFFFWGLILIFVISSYYSSRNFEKIIIELQEDLHNISHFLRDAIFRAKCIGLNLRMETDQVGKVFFNDFNNQLANRVKNYFSKLIDDSTIECAIRIAEKTGNSNGTIVHYVTVGRSDGFNPSRTETSEPIPANKGIPRFFAEKGSRGALIYHNLKEADEVGAYFMTKNDDIYKSDVKTIMVSPIKGLEEGKIPPQKSVLGLLYITSQRDPFSQRYVEPIRCFADLLGIAFPQIVEIVSNNNNQKTQTRGEYDVFL